MVWLATLNYCRRMRAAMGAVVLALTLLALVASPTPVLGAGGGAGGNSASGGGGAASTSGATKPPTEDCKLAEALQEAGDSTDVVAAFKAELEANPESPCASEGLKKALEAGGPNPITSTVEDITGSIPTILVIVDLLIIACFVFLMLGYIQPLNRQMQRVPIISFILRPRLSFESIVDVAVGGAPGEAILARIKELLGRMRDEDLEAKTSEYDLDLGSPQEEFADLVSKSGGGLKSSLENASDISDQTKIVAALLQVVYGLLPISRYEISGSLQPPTMSGAAVTLLLERNARPVTAVTLHSPPPVAKVGAKGKGADMVEAAKDSEPKASDYAQLADPAAVWIQFEVARSLSGKAPKRGATESHALVREGIDFYSALDNLAAARACFEKAIRLDRENWSAYACLTVAEARSGEDFDAAIKRATEGLDAMRNAAEEAKREAKKGKQPAYRYRADPTYYRLGYQLAAQLMNSEHAREQKREQSTPGPTAQLLRRPSDAGAGPTPEKTEARTTAESFERDAQKTLERFKSRENAQLFPHCHGLRETEKRLQAFLKCTVVPCLELVIAACGRDESEARSKVKRLELRAGYGNLSYRALYNLSCYEATNPKPNQDLAFKYLGQALRLAPGDRQRELVRWANEDPSLKSLPKEELKELLDSFDSFGQSQELTSTNDPRADA
jgi:tetratricopeptide (TPR) repeat protein